MEQILLNYENRFRKTDIRKRFSVVSVEPAYLDKYNNFLKKLSYGLHFFPLADCMLLDLKHSG